MINNKDINKGFTLVELLVTISIIGVLAALSLVSFTGAQKQTRDTKRKSDLKQYQNATESYSGRNAGLYPLNATTVSANETLCTDLSLTDCPSDSKEDGSSNYGYKYQSTANRAGYVLWALLENSEEYWVLCSNGKVGPVDATGFGVTGGVCPLP